MSALIIRIPDEKRERLKTLAKSRNVSVNKLIEEMATVMLAEFDAETRFRLRASRGHGRQARGIALLKKAAGRARSSRRTNRPKGQ
jgi:predicted DNA-binding protein